MLDEMWGLLWDVRNNPVEYIGKPDLERLWVFFQGMRGYFMIAEEDSFWILPDFRDFLVNKYSDPGGSFGYIQIIQKNCRNEKEAFYRFYELLEEFLALKGEDYQPFVPCNMKGQIKYNY